MKIPCKVKAVTVQLEVAPNFLYVTSIELGAMKPGDTAVLENWADQMAPFIPRGEAHVCDAVLGGLTGLIPNEGAFAVDRRLARHRNR